MNPEAHEPIVDRPTWLAAQRKAPRQPRSGEVKLLTGLVRCDSCGYAMSVNSNGRGVRNYVCTRRDVCPAPAQIQARLLERFVEEWYMADLGEGSQFYGIAEVHDDAELQEAERDLERAEDRLRRFLAPEIQDTLEPAAFAAGVRERQELVDRATERVAELRAAQGAPAEPRWFDAAETWPILPVEHKRDILRSVIEEVRVKRGRGNVDERVCVVRKV